MSFYTSLSGLKNAQTGLGVTANNISNAETLGFKKSRTLFADLVAGGANANPKTTMGIGSTVQSIAQNYAMGPIEQTGGALDLAINGDGFFAAKNAATGAVTYTRNGTFTVDDSGYVNDANGHRLQVFGASNGATSGALTDLQLPIGSTRSPYASATVNADGKAQVTFANGTSQTVALPSQSTPSPFAGATVQAGGTVTVSYADQTTESIALPTQSTPPGITGASIASGVVTITYADSSTGSLALPTQSQGTPPSAFVAAAVQPNNTVMVSYADGTSESIALPTLPPSPFASAALNPDNTVTVSYANGQTDTIGLPTASTPSPFAGGTVQPDGSVMVAYANGKVESVALPTQSTPSPFAGVTVEGDGSIKVSFADGTNQTLGKVALAQFPAVNGLKQVGSSNWSATGLSGEAEYGVPGGTGLGSLLSGSIERSNVDITEELVGLITMQRYFQANAKAIDTAGQISQTVLNLRT